MYAGLGVTGDSLSRSRSLSLIGEVSLFSAVHVSPLTYPRSLAGDSPRAHHTGSASEL